MPTGKPRARPAGGKRHDAAGPNNEPFLRRLIANPAAYPQEFAILPLDPDILSKIFTKERARLIRHLRENGPAESVQELAEALDRPISRVSRDVGYLDGLLVQVTRTGKTKRIEARDVPIFLR